MRAMRAGRRARQRFVADEQPAVVMAFRISEAASCGDNRREGETNQ